MPKDVTTRFGADTAPLKAGVREAQLQLAKYDASIRAAADAQTKINDANDRFARVAGTAFKVGAIGAAGFATALAASAVAAVNFDAAMRNVNSIAGLNQKQFVLLEGKVKSLALALGSSPTELAAGLYDIVSTGFKANDAIKVLAVSAKAGKAGLTDTATATDAITSALKAYGEGAGSAKKVSDLLFETVDVGKLNFSQLAGAIGTVLAPAATLGVPLKQLGSAISTLTLEGIDANTATTDLRGVFTAFQKPTKDLTAAFKSQGYETAAAGLKSLGLKGALDLLQKSVASGHNNWVDFFKDVRALNGAQGLEGTRGHINLFNSSTKAMNDAVKGAGATQRAFAEQQKSTAAQFDHLKASVDVAAITIGTALLPEINKGITALTAWLNQAQRSGELSAFAKTVAKDVQATVKFLEGLGPAAETGIHVVEQTFQAALPYVHELADVIKTVAPELEAVGKAAGQAASGLGAGPILGAAGVFLAVNRAALTTKSGVGQFAAIMKAGAEETARAGGGFVSASGRIDSVGKAAINAESNSKIFARGLVSSFGPQLLAVGAAGIVASILYIRSTMTSLKDEARDVIEALAQLQGAKVAKVAANIAVRQQKAVVAADRKSVGSASVAVNKASFTLAQAFGSGNPEAEIQAQKNLDAVYLHQQATIRKLQSDKNQLTQDQQDAAIAAGKEGEAQKKLGDQLVGLGQKAKDVSVKAPTTVASLGGARVNPNETQAEAAARAAAEQQRAVDKLANSIRNAAAASTTLDAAGKGAADKMADVVQALDIIPSKKQFTVIADDIAAGKTLANIKKDLGIIAIAKPKPTVDANAAPIVNKLASIETKFAKLLTPHELPISLPNAPTVEGALARISAKILHLSSTPFTVKINEAPGTAGHFNPKTGQWVYGSAGGSFISGPAGADDVPVLVTGQEAILNERQQAMVDSGGYTVRGALAATGAQTIHRGGGYSGGAKPTKPKNMKFEAFPLSVYQSREANAEAAVKTDRGKLKTYTSELSKLQNAINKAHEKVGTAKTAKTRAEYETQATALERKSQTRIDTLSPLIANEQTLLPQDVAKYQEATRIAKLAAQFAARIKRDQDNASEANSQMQLASDRWSQASTPAGKASALAAYSAAQKRRTSANQNLVALLSQAKSTIGDTGSQYFRDTQAAITAAQIDQTQNQDATGAPGYVAPGTSFDASSLVFLSAEHQYQLDKALQLDANGNPVDPGTAKYLLGLELANAQRGEAIATASGNFATASQIVQTENDIQGQLAQLSQTAAAPTADVSAQLAQSQGQVLALTRGAGYGAAAASAFSQPGLGMMTILGDPRSVQQLAGYATRGFNAMPFVVQNSGAINV